MVVFISPFSGNVAWRIMGTLLACLCLVGAGSGQAAAYALSATGQTLCYSDTAQIACPNPGEDYYGQDGNYRAGLPMSYTVPVDGIVRDNVTGLLWDRYPYTTKLIYSDLAAYCADSSLGTYDDWRLPNQEELISIISLATSEPAWNNIFSGSFSAGYMGSTVFIDDNTQHWGINYQYWFSDHDSDSKVSYTRCVRGDSATKNFISNDDGTVTDNSTGLVWESHGSTTKLSWKDALSYCESKQAAGSGGWRLPNFKELMSIIDYTNSNPAIYSAFTAESDAYWTSSTRHGHPNNGIYVDFKTGYTSYYFSKSYTSYARCVRGGTIAVVVAVLDNAPSSPTVSRSATITVGGTGVVAYKYRLDAGDWSEQASITTAISLAGLSLGTHTLAVLGEDGNGNWQDAVSPTTTSWTVIAVNSSPLGLLLLGP
ncbi:Lcl C-terminal domain-containing protein [Desulfovibrio sp. TomC]|uniref:Lcl C-terminal domain-containing protein n=1 Tax=Desulfovibrio sp. TomC TaxID=1562888 RepID=UPI0005732D9F|nr:DUF1566 domain-containing protein [Desulfovibrio sp. TomC]KHK00493.1 FimH-like protein [Desulfovibrio sp. TomC]